MPVQVVSTSPSICSFSYQAASPTTAQLLNSGICRFNVIQAGDAIYNAIEGFDSFEIYPNPVKTVNPSPTPTAKSTVKPKPKPKPKSSPTPVKVTITCVKAGWPDKKIPGANSKCPTGYKKK